MSKLQDLYLRPNVVIEPLVNRWPAQLQLLAPVPTALTIAHVHSKLLESFTQAPDLHIEASRHPELAGGKFVCLAESYLPQARSLLNSMRTEAELFDVADAVSQLNRVIDAEAKGLSLYGTYAKVPEILRGFVELVYDGWHRCRVRYLEPLLYKSRLYRNGLQSVHLSLADNDERASIHSTPRLDGPGSVNIAASFRDERLDALVRARVTPTRLDELCETLGITSEQSETFQSFFTVAPPRRVDEPEPSGRIRVRYLGHAGVLIEGGGSAIIVDPVLGYGHGTSPFRHTFADLPSEIDALLITHAHPDHFNLENLLQLRHVVRQIVVPRSGMGSLVDPSLELALRAAGFTNVVAVDCLDRIRIRSDTEIVALPFFGEHADLEICSKTCYAITVAGKTLVLAADAAAPEPQVYDLIRSEFGHVEALFLAMEPHGAPLSWGYSQLLSRSVPAEMDRSRRQRAATADEVIAMLQRIKPRRLFNYAMGLEPWMFSILGVSEGHATTRLPGRNKVAEYCEKQGIVFERPFASMDLVL